MARTKYRAGIVTVHMTPEQAARWNDGGIDASGPDGDTIMVEWGSTTDQGLPSSQLVSLRQACLIADILAVKDNGGWLSDSLESPAQQEPTALPANPQPKETPTMNPVANTILAQLGHNRFIAMTGAKMFVGDEKSLTFRLPNGTACNGINCITITLNDADTYDIRFGRVRGADYTHCATARNVYAQNLCSAFTSYTGLETSLGVR